MAYKIFFSEDALRDLEDILDYIRVDNEAAADSFGSALLDYLEILKGLSSHWQFGLRAARRAENPAFPYSDLLQD